MNLAPLVEMQADNPEWGGFAQKVLQWGPNPRNGKKSDQAHPPIHPTKYVTNLTGNEKKIYELVVRHFLACISKDALGSETVVNAVIAEEEFTASGLCILERNYLEVYPYDRWNSREIHPYQVGNTFEPTELSLHEGSTTAPNMLTEADLIALMEKHGIGTDATHAEHINTIKERGYIGEADRGFLVPGTLGMGLVEGYEAMDLSLAQPELRAGLEADLKLICEGRKDSKLVLEEQIQKYKEAYRVITQKASALDQAMAQRLNEVPKDAPHFTSIQEVCKCPKCSQMMCLKMKKDGNGFYLGCLGFPECRNSVWFDENIKEASGTDEACPKCGGGNKKMTVKFKHARLYGYLSHTNNDSYKTCIVCDNKFREILGIADDLVKQFSSNGIRADVTIPPRGNAPSGNFGSTRPSQNFPSNPSSGRGTGSSANNGGRSGWGSNNDDDDDDRRGGGGGAISSGTRTNNTSSSGWGSGFSSSSTTQNRPTASRPNSDTTWNRNPAPPPSRTSFGANDGEIRCGCNLPAKPLTVRKDGPNKGRPFFGCSKAQGKQCGFFKWADEDNAPQGGTSGSSTWGQARPPPPPHDSFGGGGGSRGGSTSEWGRSNNKGPNAKGGDRPKATRKCGFCRQEGHTKAKCPQRESVDY